MSPRSIEVPIGPPYTGLNTYADPRALGADKLTEASWADLSRGTVTGYYGPGDTIKTVSGGARFAFYQPGYTPETDGWFTNSVLLTSGVTNWACRDAADADGNAVAYITQVVDNSTTNSPLALYGTTPIFIGVAAPSGTQPDVVSGGSGGDRAYSYTYYDSTHGIESNPLAITATSTNATGTVIGGVTPFPTSTPAGTAVNYIRIYGTNAGSLTGTQYRLAEIAIAAGDWTDPGTNGDQLAPLNWGADGYYTSTALPYDHSEAPRLTCLSDGLHASIVGDESRDGLGIVFGAVGPYVVWSRLGYPHYWPATQNKAKLPFTVLAMATRGAVTYAFTEGGIWAFSGLTDTSIQIQRLTSVAALLKNAGKSVSQAPEGILYTSREGPMLLAGSTARALIQGTVAQATWNKSSTTFFAGAYFDGWYYVQVGTESCYALDMRSGAVSVTTMTLDAGAFSIVPATAAGPIPGLYVVNNITGTIKPWRPMEGSNVTGASQHDWSVTTAQTDMGHPGKIKRFSQVRAAVSGNITLTVNAYALDGTLAASAGVNLTKDQRTYRLPPGLDAVHFTFTFDPVSSGAVSLISASLIGEVWDAA